MSDARRNHRGRGLPAEVLAQALRQRAHDQVVRVLDQVSDELVGQTGVERDRVPVALVEVVSGTLLLFEEHADMRIREDQARINIFLSY